VDPAESIRTEGAVRRYGATKTGSRMRFADRSHKTPGSHSEAPQGDVKVILVTRRQTLDDVGQLPITFASVTEAPTPTPSAPLG